MKKTSAISCFTAIFLSLTFYGHAEAQCSTSCDDAGGAVSLPSGFNISLPFEAGERVRVSAGYGPNAGSSWHCYTRSTNCANDYYALDFILPDHPNNGTGRPVLAIASGTVLHAGWGSEGWASYGKRVYIVHDYNADGNTYTSLYSHLNSINVSTGQSVSKGQVLGTLGRSSQNNINHPMNPHLHFAIHRNSHFGGSGSGGSYGGRAVIPEPMDGYTGITRLQDLISANGEDEPDEPDPQCDLIIGSNTEILEENHACTSLRGGPHQQVSGHGGSAYRITAEHPEPHYNQGLIWDLHFSAVETYHLDVYIPTGVSNLTRTAVYRIQYAGSAATTVRLDHDANSGQWVRLGTFQFNPADNGDQWVRIGNNYGQISDEGRNIIIDALRLTPAIPCTCTQEGEVEAASCADGNGTKYRECDGCEWGEWGECIIDEPDCTCTQEGEVEAASCADGNGMKYRECNGCEWGEWGECIIDENGQDPDLPDPGENGDDEADDPPDGDDNGDDSGDENWDDYDYHNDNPDGGMDAYSVGCNCSSDSSDTSSTIVFLFLLQVLIISRICYRFN